MLHLMVKGFNMPSPEIIVYMPDREGNLLGTLLITPLNNLQELEYEEFSKTINKIKVECRNVPRVYEFDQKSPLQFSINSDKKGYEHILLLEETEYELIFNPHKPAEEISFPTLEEKNNVFKKINFHRSDIHGGILNFTSFVGKSFFDVEVDGISSLRCPFEVRSKKINYIDHYSAMIGDLAQAATALILDSESPLHRPIDFQKRVKKTFYEDFMFLEYIFRPENLLNAYGHIRRDPHSLMLGYSENVPVSQASAVGESSLIDMASGSENLIKIDDLPPYWPLEMDNHVPHHLNQLNYVDSVDNAENRFIKYFLYLLQELIEEMVLYVEENVVGGYPSDKIKEFQEIIQEYVSDGWLEDVGDMNYFPSNSQVLQKKEGYREMLNYFLIFEFSYNFQFEEVTGKIEGYQKKLSELYEYWCYLKLVEILSKMGQVTVDYSSIFNLNKKYWNIKINRGSQSRHKFNIKIDEQDLEIYLEFNSMFRKSSQDYHSYSLNFNPDYTITVKNDFKRFLHFDAKYKSDDDKFKNEDVNKMHTYKDALKETMGAYVLYPGKKSMIYRERSECILPSVGAFPLTPGGSGLEDEAEIKLFLERALQIIGEDINMIQSATTTNINNSQ
ncbi:MAG: DUF2357 domain-containing protein [Methanomicrobiales archaeon]